jgi:hypothetical protein
VPETGRAVFRLVAAERDLGRACEELGAETVEVSHEQGCYARRLSAKAGALSEITVAAANARRLSFTF